MIFDSITNLKNYIALYPQLDAVLTNSRLLDFENGKFEIANSVFKIGLRYNTKQTDGASFEFEAHRKYVDVQIVITGREKITVSPTSLLATAKAYHEEDDFQLFVGVPKAEVILSPGYFVILDPHDAHCTSIAVAEPMEVTKIVFKLPVE